MAKKVEQAQEQVNRRTRGKPGWGKNAFGVILGDSFVVRKAFETEAAAMEYIQGLSLGQMGRAKFVVVRPVLVRAQAVVAPLEAPAAGKLGKSEKAELMDKLARSVTVPGAFKEKEGDA